MKSLAKNQTHRRCTGKAILVLLAVIVGLAIELPCALAQSGAGSIQGTVSDSTGAVIPGAKIHVVNQATGVAVDTQSNGVGFYQVPELFTGTYVLTATVPAMKTYKTTIELLVSQNAVINPSLSAGDVSQQIEVNAETMQLVTQDSGVISNTLENSRINQLPMNGRSILQLAAETAPGLGSCDQQYNGACANGLFGEAEEWVADGVTLTNREYGGEHANTAQLPDPDSIQEVQVQTDGLGAQATTPASVVITTKSGTNSLHGTMFETARNNVWGIAKARQNSYNYAAPRYIRNEFGASGGGPIVIPHLYNGKDRSFWFVSFERYSLASFSSSLFKVPTAGMRTGDFSGLISSSGVLQQLYDPSTTAMSTNCNGTGTTNNYCRAPFTNNQIPIGRLSPTAKILFDITPPATSSANPLVTTNLDLLIPTEIRAPNTTFRLDHEFDANNHAYLRFTDQPYFASYLNNGGPSIAADGFPQYATGETVYLYGMYAAALGYTHTFSPSFYAETILSQQWWGEQNTMGGTPNANFEQKMGLPNNFGEVGFPAISGGLYSFSGTMGAYGETQIISNLDENMTKMVGRHQMQFGGRYRHERFGILPSRNGDTISVGAETTGLENPSSGANYTATPNTGDADADMFLGSASNYTINSQPPYMHAHDMEFDAYFQDNFHVRRDLTLNLGLRYEAHPALWVKYGQMQGFDLKNDAIVTAVPTSALIAQGFTTQAAITNDITDGAKFETPQQAGWPDKLMRDYNLNFLPRVGFAYHVLGNKWGTVLRGAYGRYDFPLPISTYMFKINGKNNPYSLAYTQDYTTANQSPDALPAYLLRYPQPEVMGVNSTNVVNSSTTTSILPGINEYNADLNFAPDFASQTNVTLEQPLKGNSVLRLSWIWTHGTNLDQSFEYNYHPTTYVWELETGTVLPTGTVIGSNQYAATATGPYDQTTWASGSQQEQKTGWSNDNALQANYQRLFHHGIAYQIQYVWSRPFRAGGDANRSAIIYPTQDYAAGGIGVMTPAYGAVLAPNLPPPRPTGLPAWAYYHSLNRFENYMIDTAVPQQHIQFNGIVDLPVGRGKRFLGNANRFFDELVGGFQLAGDGNIGSQDFLITATNYGPTNPLHVYKHGAPITDCRSGVCYKAYEWFNGYIAPTSISGNTCAGTSTKVVSGLPSNWAPYQSPVDTTCTATSTDKYYGLNEVNISLSNGTTSPITYAPSPSSGSAGAVNANPFSKTVLPGPINWTADLSLFKVFPITERFNLRFNMDAFNVFNMQGYTNPSATDGTEQVAPGVGQASSANTARQVQFTLRLSF